MKKSIAFMLLAVMIATLMSTLTFAESGTITSLGEGKLLPTSETTIEIDASKGDFAKIEHIALTDNSTKKVVSAEISCELKNNKLSITIYPYNNFGQNKTYTLKLYTSSNAFAYALKTDAYVNFNDFEIQTRDVVVGMVNTQYSKGGVIEKYSFRRIEIPANPSKGFYFPYFLEVPVNLSGEFSKHLMVIPNNTSYVNSAKYVEEILEKDMYSNRIGINETGALGMPLLIPSFPRPVDQFLYTHMLDEETLFMTKAQSDKFNVGNLVGIDKQLTAMVADAKEQFKSNSHTLNEKIVLMGFSASSDFVHRYSMIYPETIEAVIHQTTVPVFAISSYKNTTLNFPIGIADYKLKFGKEFNLEAFKKIKQFWYVGSGDHGNILEFRDGFNEKDRNTWANTFSSDGIKRFEIIKSVYKDYSNIQFHTFNDIAHNVNSVMEVDFIRFLKANLGKDKLVPINASKSANFE